MECAINIELPFLWKVDCDMGLESTVIWHTVELFCPIEYDQRGPRNVVL